MSKEMLIKEIQTLPENYTSEVYDFVLFLKIVKNKRISDTMLASEKSLAMDWLLPEEDVAWANL